MEIKENLFQKNFKLFFPTDIIKKRRKLIRFVILCLLFLLLRAVIYYMKFRGIEITYVLTVKFHRHFSSRFVQLNHKQFHLFVHFT